MCFSAAASFTLGGILVTGGAYSIKKALDTDKRYLALALMPALVGLQQISEGMVWLGLDSPERAPWIHPFSLIYMFFVWMVWPVLIPVATSMLEPDERKKVLISIFAIFGILTGISLYVPLLFYPSWLTAEAVQHSVSYNLTLLQDHYMPRQVTYILYLSLIGGPPLLSSYFHLNLFGIALVLMVPLTYAFYFHAGVSVLCFFAALLMLYILYVIIRDKCRTVIED